MKEKKINIVQFVKENAIYLFISGFLLISIYAKFMGVFNLITGLPTQMVTYLYYGLLWLFLGIYVFYNYKKAFHNLVVVAGVVLLISGVQYIFYPENAKYIWNFELRSIITFSSSAFLNTALFITIGLAVEDRERFCNILHGFARFGIIAGVLTYILFALFSLSLNYDDMVYSYALCFLVCFLIAMSKKNDFFFIIAGSVCMFISGTRGPILCVIIALILKYFILEVNLAKIIAVVTASMATVILMITGLLGLLINQFGELLNAIGFTDLRIIDYINSGIITDSSGRDDIYAKVLEGVFEKPLFGYGLGGDRIILGSGGRYSHNIFLELFASFGIIIGGVLIVLLAVMFLNSLYSKDRYLQILATTFFSAAVIKLFLSGSIIQSIELFMFIGIYIFARCNKMPDQIILKSDNKTERENQCALRK